MVVIHEIEEFMADLSITAANVKIGSDSTRTKLVQAGEAVAQGKPVYPADNGKYYLGDANDAAKANSRAIALTPASTDGWFLIAEGSGGVVVLGATLVVGETYVVSNNVGGICPIGDLTSGSRTLILGFAISTTELLTLFAYSTVAKA